MYRLRASRRCTSRHLLIAAIAAALLPACSIQAPNVQLVGQGGQVVDVPTSGSAATAPGASGAQAPANLSSGASSSSSHMSAAQQNACLGKATDVGVSGNQIELGSNFAVSGPVSNISGPILKGVQSYFNKVNDAGGVYGRKIYLKWYDDGWDAQRGKAYIKRLVEQD
jgi:ABC-type branched-subunit amino acid transport system substrate-binding protein